MLLLRPPRGFTLASATARITKLREASASPRRQASSLRLPGVGALIRARMDKSLASGALAPGLWVVASLLVQPGHGAAPDLHKVLQLVLARLQQDGLHGG